MPFFPTQSGSGKVTLPTSEISLRVTCMETSQPRREHEIVLPSNRSFGLLFCFVFLVVAFWPIVFGGGLRLWAVAISALFALAALVVPGVLTPLNRLWMKFGALLHRIVSPIVLGILFFVVITPYGLVMRAFKRDPLRLRREPADTYWVDRSPPGPAPDSMDKQF